MPKQILLLVLLYVLPLPGTLFGQQTQGTLFGTLVPLNIRLRFPIEMIRREKNDTVFYQTVLHYKNDLAAWDSLTVSLRGRGNFRMENCFFPPIRLKISKKEALRSPFEGNRSLKLVLPCKNSNSDNHLIWKEYLCYRIYETVTQYSFRTRPAQLELRDLRGMHDKSYSVAAFFIEDDDKAAKRLEGKVLDGAILHPLQLQDTAYVRLALFEYLIGNTDWSTVNHNLKVIQTGAGKKIPIAYDFDMAGLVNAPYAKVNESLELHSVRERLYRGFCRESGLTQLVRADYLALEPAVLKVIEDQKNLLEENEISGIKKYVSEFYAILRKDRDFKEQVLDKCRTQ